MGLAGWALTISLCGLWGIVAARLSRNFWLSLAGCLLGCTAIVAAVRLATGVE